MDRGIKALAERDHCKRGVVKMLRQFGIAEDRCRFDYVSAAEGEKFVAVVSEMVERLKALASRVSY